MRWIALVLALVACRPWYRDDELRARRADDTKLLASMEASAQAKLDAREYGDAASEFENVIAIDPSRTSAYLGLARAKARAGHGAQARAVANLGLESGDSSGAAVELRVFLVSSYTDEGLIAKALGQLDAATTLADAAAMPPLTLVLGELAASAKAARSGNPREALDHFARWLASYGVPDHPLLRRWADEIRESITSVTTAIAAHAEAADPSEPVAALRAYAAAFRYLPSDRSQAFRERFVTASARVPDLSILSPVASASAAKAEESVRQNRLAAALEHYRHAVAAAPWWPELHYNLAVLLASAEVPEEAALQMGWFLELAPQSPRIEGARALQAKWTR